MARKKHRQDSAAETLDELESLGDRLVAWVGENPVIVLGTALGILLLAAAWGFGVQSRAASRSESSDALARVQGEYRVAMGATPGSIDIPEPANPDTARRVRGEYVARYVAVADAHAGTTASALALLEAGKLQQALGEPDSAIASFERGLEQADGNDAVKALLLTRIAAIHESQGRWSEAARAYQAAAELEGFPLRFDALADAARSHAQAGDTQAALDAYRRLKASAPGHQLQPHIEARLEELGSGARAGGAEAPRPE